MGRCIALNIASLVCGFIGNLFLLLNFTKRVRYIVALPMIIVMFYFATGILTAITSSMHIYVPPKDGQIYSQGFWHAVIAAALYLFNSMILMVNMLGYFLGHYPQHFTLTDEQRNLILQTIMFFIWLGAGGAVFSAVCGWTYPDSLYFCEVTILTIGFGDFTPPNDTGRGLVFPFSVGGIIILGLMVSSIHKFAQELSQDNVIRKHMETARNVTLSRIVTEEVDTESTSASNRGRQDDEPARSQFLNSSSRNGPLHNTLKVMTAPVRLPVQAIRKVRSLQPKVLIMKEEKDRFDAMRNIQRNAATFKKWYALTISVIAFGLLWCIGAVVFWQAEKNIQGMTYFQGLYFCYVSLLTIGYGDLSPKSNAGKPFFIVWSLIAVPTMTILISDMGDTVIASFKKGTFVLADWTVLPKEGLYREMMEHLPWLWNWLQSRAEARRVKKGFKIGVNESQMPIPTLEELATEDLSEAELTKQLAFAIRKTADDLGNERKKRYTYEEWVEFTRLIRFSKVDPARLELEEEEEGVVDWDWLEPSSPMLSEQTEAEWVLDRLCESLLRLIKKHKLGEKSDGEMSDGEMIDVKKRSDEDEPDPATHTQSAGFRHISYAPQVSRETDSARRNTDTDTDTGVDPRHRAIGLFPEMGRESPGPPRPAFPEKPVSETQERPRRASGADVLLNFFTGERRGTNAYVNRNQWSARAMEKMAERRRSSAADPSAGVTAPRGRVRQGPFSKIAAAAGGRGGVGHMARKA